MEKIIGIDLGTSNSAAAVVISGKPVVIPSAEGTTLGGKAFPSYVAFTKDGQLLVGEPARRQALLNPEGTVYAAKRKMGTDYKYKIFGKEYTPQQISAFILQKIKRDAEAFLGEKITKAVITVPAYFNDNQRQATKDAGTIAGLEVVRIINEPTAASLAYGIDKSEKEQKILVYDFGGGTLDVTVMEFGNGVFQVLSTSGDTQLGGTDMDNALINYIADEFKKQEGIDLRNDKNAYIRLRDAAEKAKIELSTSLQTEINLPYITSTPEGPKHLVMTITRAKLEELVSPLVERTGESIKKALEAAKLSKEDIDKIILVGGPTRMPIVQRYVENYFGKKIERGVDPMECVAIGAAIEGAVLAGEIKDIVLLDVTPLTLSVETLGGIATPIIPANTTIPTRKSQIFTTAADFQTVVTIHVVQGERPLAKDNVSLGMFNLEGIPPAPRGVPQIEVTFDIDANGILNVTAKDLATGKQNSITITSSTKLSKEQIEKMKKEAEQFAEQDRKKKEEIETLNNAESLVYSSEKFINEYREKLPKEEVEKAQGVIGELRQLISSKEIDKIKEKMKELENIIQSLGASMYKNVGQKEQGKDFVDTDYKEKKE
ncbi:MAG: molecular chaperone DnaK [Thermoplasmata archaeon]|jgi:molecular chaperone DnaK|nr:molecular chaperone DnaK [Euryarchaeota archaeon]MVT14273.1 molecular chaperone DnaK [Euryarchaeota archaeon]MVT36343.1 molecular chaperone DnaK [Euryarchaeota archaeon]